MDLRNVICLAVGFLAGGLFFHADLRGSGAHRPGVRPPRSPASPEMRRRVASQTVEASPEIEGQAARPGTRVAARSARSITPDVYVFEWMDELAGAMESGELLEALSHEPVNLGYLLFDWAIYRGDAERAAELAEVLPCFWEEDLAPLVDVYLARGDRAHSTELALRTFAADPEEEDFVEHVLDLAPAEALRLLESEFAEELAEHDHDKTLVQVRLLQRLGLNQEARTVLTGLIDSTPGCSSPAEALELLAEVAPDLYEERVRNYSDPDAHLVPFLLDQGRLEEAETLLEANLAALPEDTVVWSQLGELHWARGDPDEAVESWLQCWQLGGSGHVDELLRLAPDRALALAKGDAIRTGNAWLWGEYGDFCWRVGRRFEAETAWRRARELRPDAWDWMDRLEKLAIGVDPLDEDAQVTTLDGWIEGSLTQR